MKKGGGGRKKVQGEGDQGNFRNEGWGGGNPGKGKRVSKSH